MEFNEKISKKEITCIFSKVKKAARLAVYDETMIIVKNHQADEAIRPETDLKTMHFLKRNHGFKLT